MDRKATVAKNTDLCFGTERTVDRVYEQIEAVKNKKVSGPIYIYDLIIHNEETARDLSDKGAMVLETEGELRTLPRNQGMVITRSHGVSRHVYEILKERNVAMVDATRLSVKKIHRIVAEHSAAGEAAVIIGSLNHPEVEGTKGWGDEYITVIVDGEGVDDYRLPEGRKLYIVSQTILNYNKLKELVEKFSEEGYDNSVLNTICNAAQERQVEAARIASQVDAMIVIDDRYSSNTQRFYRIYLKECKDTFYIQILSDPDPDSVSPVHSVGITARASAPRKVIEEVYTRMAEQGFAELLKGEGESTRPICTEEIVTSQVIETSKDEIILSIVGNKPEGVITRSEYSNSNNVDLTTKVQVGERMKVKVIKFNDGIGMVSLSYKRMAINRGNKCLKEAFENQEVLTAEVAQISSDGLSVRVEGARVFIPTSPVPDSHEGDLPRYIGQNIGFAVTEFNPRKRRTTGDKKQLLVVQKVKLKEGLFTRIQPGDTADGIVKSVTGFSTFVDLGDADGLLHISGMSWGRVENPEKVFRAGDQVRVLIRDIQREKIALSLKFPEANPWVNAADKYAVGNVVHGRVARTTDFGAFVELGPGANTLLYVSQISREHVEKPVGVLRIGQETEARMIDFNEADHRTDLSIEAVPTPVAQDADMADMDIDAMSQYIGEQDLSSRGLVVGFDP